MYNNPKEISPARVFLHKNSCFKPSSDIGKMFMNSNISTLFPDRVLLVKTNCPLFALLAYNKDNYQQLVKLGILDNKPYESSHPAIHGFQVLSYVMRNLIVYNKDFIKILNERKYTIGMTNCIGFHIRMGNKKSDFQETRNFIFDSDIESFSNCPRVTHNNHIPIFVASDSSYVKSIIKNKLKDHKVLYYTSTVRHSESISFDKNFQLFNETFLELLSLSQCNDMIGTYGSTYSILAASLNGKLPYLVTRNSKCFLPQEYFYY